MSNLTECKDCGHEVSKRAKVCPSCGVGNPANRTSAFTKIMSVIAFFFVGSYILVEVVRVQNEYPSPKRSTTTPAPATLALSYAQIQQAIAQSDDYEVYKANFTKAATYLLTTKRCKLEELVEMGGFVKAQGENKLAPIYFTYCGGMTVSNRLYVDAATGKVYK